MRSVEEMFIVVSPLFSRSFESSLLKLKPLRSSEGCWYEEQHLAVRYRLLELKLPLRVSVCSAHRDNDSGRPHGSVSSASVRQRILGSYIRPAPGCGGLAVAARTGPPHIAAGGHE